MTITFFYIILAILFGLIIYLTYTMTKIQRELDQIWAQIVVLVASTTEKLIELDKKKQNKENESTNK